MRVLSLDSERQVREAMRGISVDAYGIDIMAPKALTRLIKIEALSNIAANVLKQEMLSLGGDAAIARGSLTGQVKKTDCLLMGTPAQFGRLVEKLKKQPFGLAALALNINVLLENYGKNDFTLSFGKRKLHLSRRTHVMGIVNITPDSFSGDGQYLRAGNIDHIVDRALSLADDGADIVDLGGESSRPGAQRISVKEEIRRVVPVVKKLAKSSRVPISVDTCKPAVAKAALDCGADIVNDITGLRDVRMAKIVSRYKCGVVIMHMKATPRMMQKNPHYKSVVSEIIEHLRRSINSAFVSGIREDKIIIDPGIGFGKDLEHNLQILRSLREFKSLGMPIMVGASRKSFIGKISGVPVEDRLSGSIAAAVLAASNGAHIVRVHDVKQTVQALKIADALR